MPYAISKIIVKGYQDAEEIIYISQHMTREEHNNAISNLVGKRITTTVSSIAYTADELKVKWQEAVAKNNTEMGFLDWLMAGVKYGHFITDNQVKTNSW